MMIQQVKKATLFVVSKIALRTAETEANSACICIGYQPKVPGKLKKSRN